MKKLLILLLFINFVGFAQKPIDSLSYLEDQLFFSYHYNKLFNEPKDVKQYGVSSGISFGFIKDIPLNKQQNIGLGIGLGYTLNSFKNNLKIIETNADFEFIVIENDFISNKITTNTIDFPIEFRWRTSTLEKYKFWRIYTGVKIAYLLKSNYTYTDIDSSYTIKNPEVINKWQYGLTLSVGYGAFNLYTYYGLNPMMKNIYLNNLENNPKNLKFGLIFYIL